MNERIDGLPVPWVTMDPAAERDFETALADNARLAYRVAYSVLRQRQDAEDVAQDALIRAHGRRHQLRDATRLRAWVVRLAWRMALDRRRSDMRRSAREHAHDGIAAPPAPEDVVLLEQRRKHLWEMIDALPEKLRVVVVLNSIQEHDVEEVGAILGIPEGTVKSRLFEARRKLREWIDGARPGR